MAEQERRNQQEAKQDWHDQETRSGPHYETGQHVAYHGEEVECQEAGYVLEYFGGDEEAFVGTTDACRNGGEHGQRDKEHEEHVEELGEGFLEDGKVGGAGAHLENEKYLLKQTTFYKRTKH